MLAAAASIQSVGGKQDQRDDRPVFLHVYLFELMSVAC